MKIVKKYKALIIIFLLALGVRLFLLGTYPLGFHADEIRVGWNSYSILQTGKDDLGNRFALYYNTFGDYRPTAIFYVTIPSLIVFGLTQFAIRFPSALFGALTVFPLYALSLQFQQSKTEEKQKNKMALLSVLFLAVSPWHVFVSRATSEGVICLFFALTAMCIYIYALQKDRWQWFLLAFSIFVVSALFYHMVRPLLPLFVFTILIYYWKKLSFVGKRFGFVFCLAVSLFVVLLLSTAASRARFSQVAVSKYQDNVLGLHTSKFELPTQIKNEYAKYLGLDFLTGDSPKPYRYRVFGVGLISIAVAAFFAAGLIPIFRRKKESLVLALFLLSPLPAAVTGEDSPNLHRALFMLPFLVIIAGYGAYYLWHHGFIKRLIVVGLMFLFITSTVLSIKAYFTSGALDATPYRNYGASTIAQTIFQYEHSYKHIIVSDDPDALYPWYAFEAHKDPDSFNKAALARKQGDWTYDTITFTQNKCPSATILDDKQLTGSVLVIDSPFCDTKGTQIAHPEAKLELLPKDASAESQYHFWERAK